MPEKDPTTWGLATWLLAIDCVYWLYRRPIWITKNRFIDLFIGWNLPGAKYGRAKFTSSFRIKTKL